MAIHYYSTHEHISPEEEIEEVRTEVGYAPRAAQAVWGVFYVVLAFLLFRFGLKLAGASAGAPFTAFVYGVSGFFLYPFQYMLPAARSGRSILEWSNLGAMLVYWVLALLIARLFRAGASGNYGGTDENDHRYIRRVIRREAY